MLATLEQTRPRLEIIRKDAWIPEELKARIRGFSPKSRLGEIVKECLRFLPAELAGEVLERITSCVIMESSLSIVVDRMPDSPARHGGPCHEDHGIVSRKKVTTTGVTQLAIAWANATFAMKYQALGTDATAEANTQSLPIAEIVASHYDGSVRPTCTHVESGVTVPLTVLHTQKTAQDIINEHVIADSATQGAGVGWDRSLTGAITLAVNDTLTPTYTLTLSAEA